MDTLYIGDIPSEYCYALFGENYIDLYKDSSLIGHEDFYRVYLYDNTFMYEHNFTNYADTVIPTLINTTSDYMYRRDFPSIMFMSVVYITVMILLLNLVTSVFKRGGVLSGLL